MLTIGGDEVDIGPKSMQTLRRIVRDTLRAFVADGLTKLAIRAPSRFDLLTRRAARVRCLRDRC
jgi:hypothetical protein